MISIFDPDKLRDLLKDYYELTRIRITVFDGNLSELVSYPEDVAPYCAVIRSNRAGFEACMRCDREACERAAKKRGTHIYRCHAGLTEAVTPLYVGDVLAGYLLCGHAFVYEDHKEGIAAVERLTEDLDLDRTLLRKALRTARPMGEGFVRSAAHILHAVASFLILERMAALKEDLLAVRLNAYLSSHFTEKNCASEAGAHLGVGKTKLYELSRQLYGRGIAARIRALRMEKAKSLLLERRDLTVAEIASLSGYADYNYFITVFSRETGKTPGAFRNSR
ncbi:MAG: PocR ligand-binding domain-containing protein [Clostridia bacterium]|nr:PocR ligand-binding domain-containing protein [Clostridia bacterium]